MFKQIEIKVRFCNNLNRWEEIPVTMQAEPRTAENWQSLKNKLEKLANAPLVSCVRWNEAGSLQGHYIINRTAKDNKAYLNR